MVLLPIDLHVYVIIPRSVQPLKSSFRGLVEANELCYFSHCLRIYLFSLIFALSI